MRRPNRYNAARDAQDARLRAAAGHAPPRRAPSWSLPLAHVLRILALVAAVAALAAYGPGALQAIATAAGVAP